jgi:hypothetical protein
VVIWGRHTHFTLAIAMRGAIFAPPQLFAFDRFGSAFSSLALGFRSGQIPTSFALIAIHQKPRWPPINRDAQEVGVLQIFFSAPHSFFYCSSSPILLLCAYLFLQPALGAQEVVSSWSGSSRSRTSSISTCRAEARLEAIRSSLDRMKKSCP